MKDSTQPRTATKTPINLEDIDITDDAQFDAWLEATYGAETETEPPQVAPQASRNLSETNEAKSARLEREIEKERKDIDERRERGGKPDTAAWESFDEKVAELTDLKKRMKFEQGVKERWRKEFSQNSFATADDFERLWQTKLRDEAMIEEADKDAKLEGVRFFV